MATDPNVTSFSRLSSVLTGFPLTRIAPQVDPIGLPSLFYAFVVQGQPGQPMQPLLAAYDAIDQQTGGVPGQQPPPAQAPLVQQRILDDPVLGPLARRIIRLWYLGVWYDTEPPAPMPFPPGRVVSMEAYVGGLAWDAIQAHPMGYSEMHYGYWSAVPVAPAPTTAAQGAIA
jgi:hypothetical protein